jgi:signal transduction histidine kinase
MGGAMLTTFASDLSDAERSFVAYAAHELRGEISVQLTPAQATLANPHADTAAMREMGEGIVAACWRQERLLEALLTLSRSEYGRPKSRLEQRAADRLQHQVDAAPSVNSSTASRMSLEVGVSPRGCPGSVGGW